MLYNDPKVAVSSLKETLISCSARAEVAENKKAQSPAVIYSESQGKPNCQSHSVFAVEVRVLLCEHGIL